MHKRRFTKQQFARGSRQLVTAIISAMSLFVFVGVAFAQEVVAPLDPVVSVRPTTIMGWILTILFAGVLSLFAWLLKQGVAILGEKAKQSKVFSLLNSIGLKAYAAAGKVVTRLRPLIERDLADGKIDAAELKELQDETLKVLKEIAAEEIAAAPKIIGLLGDNAVTHWLEGIAGNALRQVIGKVAPGAKVDEKTPAVEPVPS